MNNELLNLHLEFYSRQLRFAAQQGRDAVSLPRDDPFRYPMAAGVLASICDSLDELAAQMELQSSSRANSQ